MDDIIMGYRITLFLWRWTHSINVKHTLDEWEDMFVTTYNHSRIFPIDVIYWEVMCLMWLYHLIMPTASYDSRKSQVFVSITTVGSIVCDSIHYGMKYVYVCLHITQFYYQYADLFEFNIWYASRVYLARFVSKFNPFYPLSKLAIMVKRAITWTNGEKFLSNEWDLTSPMS